MRCFLALDLPSSIGESLAAIQREIKSLGLLANYPTSDQFHVTLSFFGELSANDVRNKADALASFSADSFQADVRGLGCFPNLERIRVIWAGFSQGHADIERLQVQVAQELGKGDERFHPHVTLARVKSVKDHPGVEAFLKTHERTAFGSFLAARLTLYESRLTPFGPQYVPLESVTLNPA
ncbi:RNA 2',3'-cyclic phosphodiesterase [Candidatus Micrarchaeota archaeon]|nr:RNA 2',3'-cyclic phosphodiesterase [Candidatus Micrarchaeota archaeon]